MRIHCFFHDCKTLKAVATATCSGDSFADPCQFLPFPKTKIQLSASLRPLAKNLQKQKLLLGSMWRKSKQKNWKKTFKWAAVKPQRFFTKIWFFGGFWPLLRLCWNTLSKSFFLISCFNISLFETFGKKLAETKNIARVNVKEIKAKKLKKDF